ncbi:NAD-dependent 4,6-dehydratase LegB [Bradyrhizobium erythrophlei]|uniref:dTDP-glucose 4,6-dehydratase n=1 Tax=Bradyrhizobium erythrophlei TaxID=1437360 RepID=A0A1M7UHN5_9BRAD|nr:NAD-dependent 4,6-dehydratase LegB [Bradyrhizobium erythrophlei]SHN82387.1 dTDP-glucose 4,6-dehydratase [Bradyrhizobium erythrophlei]
MAKRVLVTGADGFIGSHLTEALVRRGYDVVAFVQYNSFSSWGWLDRCDADVRGKFEVVAGDIRDAFGVAAAVKGCDAVFHLAALIAIPFSYRSPSSYIETNVTGTLNVLHAAQQFDLDRIIHTSTSEVYGTAKYTPIDEDHPLQAQSPYSASKIAADALATSFYRSFKSPVTIVRPFNTFGPRQSARAVIPTIVTQLASGKTELSLGDLRPTRDFNFVQDTASGFIAALESDRANGEIINLGTGFEISIGDLAYLIAELMNKKISVAREDARLRPEQSEVFRLLAKNDKARDILGWSPEHAGAEGLRAGLEKTIAWFMNFENRAGYKNDMFNV